MLNIPERLPLGPGPSPVPARVLQALASPTVGHLDPACLAVMDDLRFKLRQVFRTENEMTLAVSGTGSAGMECALVNLIEPGDKALVCTNGYFGERMLEIASRCGADIEHLEVPWGRAITQDMVLEATERIKPKVVALVHGETSTGVHNPIENLGHKVHDFGALLLVDCVATLGGMQIETDAWGLDCVYGASQKCLSAPPGLAPITVSPRAVEALEARKTKVRSWYLDLTLVRQYWGEDRFYHHTAPVNMLYALSEACAIALEEGMTARWERHRAMHGTLRSGLESLGLRYLSPEGHHLPVVNAVGVPEGADDLTVRRQLLNGYGIEIGAGLGEFKSKAWRIGLMGHGAQKRNVSLVLSALRETLCKV